MGYAAWVHRLCCFALLLVACQPGPCRDNECLPVVDAGSSDGGATVGDAGQAFDASIDMGQPDSGQQDGGGSTDAGADAGVLDGGARDAGALDAGRLDAGPFDGGPCGCPLNFVCNLRGSCEGDLSFVALNVTDPPTVTVSGVVTLNGATPTSLNCDRIRASLLFENVANADLSFGASVAECTALADAYSFHVTLPAGTYRVQVTGGPSSSLPSFPVDLAAPLDALTDAANVVLDVRDDPKVMLSGSITLNGSTPPPRACTSGSAFIEFGSLGNPNYSESTSAPCSTGPLTWSVQLRPGPYVVRISGGMSALPQYAYVVPNQLNVVGPQSNLVFDVVDPPQMNVSGVITLNGQPPTVSHCSFRAVIRFTHGADANYSQTVTVPACQSFADAYAWSTQLRAGTYAVTVEGAGGDDLPLFEWTVAPLLVSAPRSNVVLDVALLPKVMLSGVLTINGLRPSSPPCPLNRGTLYFQHETNANLNVYANIPSCSLVSDPYQWSVMIVPGRYVVRAVAPGYPNVLPLGNFVVTQAQSNVALDLVDPPTFSVSGSITLNGSSPLNLRCGTVGARATVLLTQRDGGAYAEAVVPACLGVTDPHLWNAVVPSGTYSVKVLGSPFTTLPQFEVLIPPDLSVTSNVSNLVLNVVDPAKVHVSGVVLLNGQRPMTTMCGLGAPRATVFFEHETTRVFDEAVEIPDCVAVNDRYAWSLDVRPGTYNVIVSGGLYSQLPSYTPRVVRLLVK